MRATPPSVEPACEFYLHEPVPTPENARAVLQLSTTLTHMANDVKWEPDDVVLFGPFRLFPANRLLEKAGTPVRLGDRALDILLILIGHAAEIVSKASLLAQVWPDLIVEENNVRVQVTLLRKALGDGEAGTRYVSTVPGRGYCFVSPISRLKMPTRAPTFVSGQGDDLLAPPRRMADRDDTVRKISEQLSAQRFVTIVGRPGVGKSTMARAIASRLRDDYRDGAHYINLAAAADPALVPTSLIEAIGLTIPAIDPIAALVAFLSDKQVLLVLDNCDHVSAAAAAAAGSLLGGAPGVDILATSRKPLRAEGEQYRLIAKVESPPATAPETTKPRTNLPHRLAPVIGRASELAELRESTGRNQLVTLVGPGGIGKTRLAIELGWLLVEQFPDGVWLVDLAPVTDPAVVVSATATVLGVALRDAKTPVDAIAAAIGKQTLLLILDNCEHLLAAAGELVAALLERVQGLSVLATSQENLHVPAEKIYRLNALALPPSGVPDRTSSVSRIADFGAVALFVERARAADRRFALDAGNAAGVAEICRCLDGVPLALEMAAARLPLLGIEGLLTRLGERIRMLTTGSHTAEARHRTLSNMVDWSHGLLDPADKKVFRRLAIFSGSFSLEAVIAVAGEKADDWDIIDSLGRLIDKSLVTAETGERPRYRLLETLRLYAMQELRRNGEIEAVAERHARYFTELFGRSDALWETAPEVEWVRIYRPEIDNVRAALDWALADPDRAHVAVTLAGTTALLWETLALFAEGRRYVDRALTLIDGETPPAAEARLLSSAGGLWYNSDRPRALAQHERSVALYRQIGDKLNLGTILSGMGSLYASLGRNAEAKAALREAEEILFSSNRRRSLFGVMNNLGTLAGFMNELDEARRSFTRALDLARAVKDVSRESYILMNLAEVEFVLGSVDRAVERAREAVSGLRSTDRGSFLVLGLINLGSYLILRGDLPEARLVAEEALSAANEEGGFVVRVCLQQWALLGALDGRYGEAAQLLGFVDAGYATSGDVRQPNAQEIHDRLLRLLTAELPGADIHAYAAQGARWSEAEAVAFAADRVLSPESPAIGESPPDGRSR
jgi:predicted ATPase/DNA-binding winged helix-turn-helix (wHTH) protein